MRVYSLLLIACCAFLCCNADDPENLTMPRPPRPYSNFLGDVRVIPAPEDQDDDDRRPATTTDSLPVNVLAATDSTPERMVEFYKHLFGELGRHHGNIAEALTPEVRGQYAQLEAHASTPLGAALTTVIELRIMDLELSLSHTHRLLEAVQQLAGH
jgi:hypothetical protein